MLRPSRFSDQVRGAQPPTHDPDDVLQPGRVGEVLTHLAVPALLVALDPVLESLGENRRIEFFDPHLALEQPADVAEVDLQVRRQPHQVIEVAALDPLDDAAELLSGNLVQRVHVKRDGVREVGYWLGREFWGRGIASAALGEFLTIDTSRPLYGVVAEHNTASRRVLERHGFVLVDRHEPDPDLPPELAVPVLVLRLDA